MKIAFGKTAIKQFVSYFCVGGIAAIVEWVCFALFVNIYHINYIVATCFAFTFSTFTNWLLGRIWTFKNNTQYQNKKRKEIILIFAVSAIGLVFNMGIMYLLVTIMGMYTEILKTVSKIIATGIVFFWNFFARKFLIYK